MIKQQTFWLKALAASSLLTIGIVLGNTSLGEIACASAQVAGLPEAYCNCKKVYQGIAEVTFTNGSPHSSGAVINLPQPCNDPVVFVQGYADSILCGSSLGPGPCTGMPGSTSTDLTAYPYNVTSSSFGVFFSADSNVWVGATSPKYRIAYQATCQ